MILIGELCSYANFMQTPIERAPNAKVAGWTPARATTKSLLNGSV